MAAKKNSAAVQEQLVQLEELKAVAEKLGIRVREEKLLRGVGYRVRSGLCRVRDDEIIFLERGIPLESQIDVIVDELATRELEQVYLSPAVRALIERAARREPEGDGEGEAAAGG